MARKIAIKSATKTEIFLNELKESLDSKIAEMNRNFGAFIEKNRKSVSKIEEAVIDNHLLVKDYHKFLEQIAHSNQAVEETLLNVLLAIRQNEYLQAWYPAQKGFDEMKVVGPHPSKTKQESQEEEESCW